MAHLFEYPDLVTSIADGLFLDLEYRKTHPQVFDFFFHQRIQDAEHLSTRLADVNNFGGNVLVVGEPGTGKTLFLQTFLKRDTHTHPWCKPENRTLIDLRTRRTTDDMVEFIDRFLGEIADIILPHLRRINPANPYNNLNGMARGADKYDACVSELHDCRVDNFHANPQQHIHYVFVDDVDYLPEAVFLDLLECLRPLLLSQYFCVIVACRSPACNAVTCHRDTNIANAFIDARRIMLSPIPVQSVLKKRIDLLSNEGQTPRQAVTPTALLSLLKGLYNKLFEFFQQRQEVADEASLFTYPFTERQHHHMQMMSNGNMRHVLATAAEYLRYMARNPDRIRVDLTGGFFVGRSAVIEHFSSTDCDDSIRIQNLHSLKTAAVTEKLISGRTKKSVARAGNSILVVLLEFYKERAGSEIVTNHIDELDTKYGVTKTDFEEHPFTPR